MSLLFTRTVGLGPEVTLRYVCEAVYIKTVQLSENKYHCFMTHEGHSHPCPVAIEKTLFSDSFRKWLKTILCDFWIEHKPQDRVLLKHIYTHTVCTIMGQSYDTHDNHRYIHKRLPWLSVLHTLPLFIWRLTTTTHRKDVAAPKCFQGHHWREREDC